MDNFWRNISRYPRFFISSLIGLLSVILAPVRNLFKIPKLRVLLILCLIIGIIFFYFTLLNMTGM